MFPARCECDEMGKGIQEQKRRHLIRNEALSIARRRFASSTPGRVSVSVPVAPGPRLWKSCELLFAFASLRTSLFLRSRFFLAFASESVILGSGRRHPASLFLRECARCAPLFIVFSRPLSLKTMYSRAHRAHFVRISAVAKRLTETHVHLPIFEPIEKTGWLVWIVIRNWF